MSPGIKFKPEALFDGQKNIINFDLNLEEKCNDLYFHEFESFRHKYKRDKIVILIDEPEHGLHPNFQKKIPKLLSPLSNRWTEFIIIVSTHSPFIISAVAELGEQEFNDCKDKTITRKQFQPTQKVYQIEDGQCQKSYGYWGNGCVQKSAEMLGAGLFYFHDIPKTKIINDVYQIYCEGANSEVNDTEFYNLVSKNWDKNVIFIGCSSCSEVNKQASIMNEFNKLQTGQAKVIAFFDSDKKDKYHGLEYAKFTNRYEFENYLYDPKIVCSCFEITLEEYISIIEEDWKNKDLKKLHKNCLKSKSKQTEDIS